MMGDQLGPDLQKDAKLKREMREGPQNKKNLQQDDELLKRECSELVIKAYSDSQEEIDELEENIQELKENIQVLNNKLLQLPELTNKNNSLNTELIKLKENCRGKDDKITSLSTELEKQKQLNTNITLTEANINAQLMDENKNLKLATKSELTKLKQEIQRLQEQLNNCNTSDSVDMYQSNTPTFDPTDYINMYKEFLDLLNRTIIDRNSLFIYRNKDGSLEINSKNTENNKLFAGRIMNYFETLNKPGYDKKTNSFKLTLKKSRTTSPTYYVFGVIKHPNAGTSDASHINTYVVIKYDNNIGYVNYENFKNATFNENDTSHGKLFLRKILHNNLLNILHDKIPSQINMSGGKKSKRCRRHLKKKTRKHRRKNRSINRR
jgi:hypothetical protein